MKMKRLFILFLGTCFAFSCTQGTDSHTVKSDNIDLDNLSDTVPEPEMPIQSIEDIQQAYSTVIKQVESMVLDSVSFEYSCGNGERSGSVSYYSHDGDLQLIVHRYAEYSHYSAEEQYLVRDSTLFFNFLKEISWSFEEGPEGSVRDHIRESRTYLLDKEPVKCLEKKYVIRSQITNNPRPETVPNEEIDCNSASSLLKKFPVLKNHYEKAPESGCLEWD